MIHTPPRPRQLSIGWMPTVTSIMTSPAIRVSALVSTIWNRSADEKTQVQHKESKTSMTVGKSNNYPRGTSPYFPDKVCARETSPLIIPFARLLIIETLHCYKAVHLQKHTPYAASAPIRSHRNSRAWRIRFTPDCVEKTNLGVPV